MSRRLAALPLALAAALLVAAAAPAATTDLTRTLAPAVQTAITQSDITVLAPTSLNLDYGGKLYVSAGGSRTDYEISIVGAKNCGSATACFLAQMSGVRGRKLSASAGVKLAITDTVTGRYQKLTCGGSCSSASISWTFAGNLYELQAKVGGKDPKQALVHAARSALEAGPR